MTKARFTYSGWIFGDVKQKYWTQTFKTGKHKFYNPVWQNYGHIKVLMNVLHIYEQDLFKSLIVFGDSCDIKSLNNLTSEVTVLKRYDVRQEIISRMNRKVFTQEQVKMIYQKLLKYTYITSSTKSDHISQVNCMKS